MTTIAEQVADDLRKIAAPVYPKSLEDLALDHQIADCVRTDRYRGFCFDADGSCITWDLDKGISTE